MNRYFLPVIILAFVASGCSSHKRIPHTAYTPATGSPSTTVSQSVPTANTTSTTSVETPTDEAMVSRQERVSLIDGALNQQVLTYNIIVGSFSVYNNAVNLRSRLNQEGFSPVLLQNEQGMYRVCIQSYNEESTARSQVQNIKRRYPEFDDAWLLIAR